MFFSIVLLINSFDVNSIHYVCNFLKSHALWGNHTCTHTHTHTLTHTHTPLPKCLKSNLALTLPTSTIKTTLLSTLPPLIEGKTSQASRTSSCHPPLHLFCNFCIYLTTEIGQFSLFNTLSVPSTLSWL